MSERKLSGGLSRTSDVGQVEFKLIHLELLFQTRIVAASFAGFQSDVSPDGRFLINSLPPNPAPLRLSPIGRG